MKNAETKAMLNPRLNATWKPILLAENESEGAWNKEMNATEIVNESNIYSFKQILLS